MLPTVAVKRGGADALIEAIEPARWTGQSHRRRAGVAGTQRRRRRTDARRICAACSRPSATALPTESRWVARVDALLLHPVARLLVLAAVMFLMFQAVFSWAAAAHGLDRRRHGALGAGSSREPAATGRCRACWSNGVIAGAGAVLVFLPQILILFFFILALEDSGYLPRAAYLLDRLMGWRGTVGPRVHSVVVELRLRHPRHHGDAHHPELARPPDHHHDRAADDLFGAPAGVRAADRRVDSREREVGPFNLQGLVLFVLYVAGIVSALIVALVMKQFAGARQYSPLMLELPDFQWPHAGQPAVGPVGARARSS